MWCSPRCVACLAQFNNSAVHELGDVVRAPGDGSQCCLRGESSSHGEEADTAPDGQQGCQDELCMQRVGQTDPFLTEALARLILFFLLSACGEMLLSDTPSSSSSAPSLLPSLSEVALPLLGPVWPRLPLHGGRKLSERDLLRLPQVDGTIVERGIR